MSTIRPLATIAILAVVGVFLAQKINEGPDGGPVALTEAPGAAPAAPAFEPLSPSDVAGGPKIDTGVLTGAPQVGGDSFAPAPVVSDPLPAPAVAPLAEAPLAADAPPVVSDSPIVPAPPASPSPSVAAAPPVAPEVPPLPPLPGPDTSAPPAAPPVTAAPAVDPNAPLIVGGPYENPMTAAPPAAQPVTAPPVAAPPVAAPPMVEAPSAGPVGGFVAAKQSVDGALARNELARALQLLSPWQNSPSLSPAQQQEVDRLLGQLAGTVIYSNQHLLEGPCTVRPGETLVTIADRYGVPWELLGKINGIANPAALRPGQTIKVVRGPFDATIDVPNRQIVLQLDGHYAGRFPVNFNGAAPGDGNWRVEQKQSAQGKAVQIADANGRKATLVDQASPVGSAPGAVSVATREMSDLYDILSVGSEVTVRR